VPANVTVRRNMVVDLRSRVAEAAASNALRPVGPSRDVGVSFQRVDVCRGFHDTPACDHSELLALKIDCCSIVYDFRSVPCCDLAPTHRQESGKHIVSPFINAIYFTPKMMATTGTTV
jgi:hypothetical protein